MTDGIFNVDRLTGVTEKMFMNMDMTALLSILWL